MVVGSNPTGPTWVATYRWCNKMEFDIRIDPAITSANGYVTREDILKIHQISSINLNGDGVNVIVMDSGIDESHPIFDRVDIEQGKSFVNGPALEDNVGHGTAVAGLYASLAPGCTIYPVRIFGDEGSTNIGVIKNAYDWMAKNVDKREIDIINMSWGGSSNNPLINSMQQRLASKGAVSVIAAGNTGSEGGSPATAEGAWGVGAITEDEELTRFSSYNPDRDNPDTTALGKDVILAKADGTSMGRDVPNGELGSYYSSIGGEWTKASGTSFAAPIQGGLAANILNNGKGHLLRRFEATAKDIPGTPEDGEGIARYQAAFNWDSGDAPVDKFKASVIDVFHPFGTLVSIPDGVVEKGEYQVKTEQFKKSFE